MSHATCSLVIVYCLCLSYDSNLNIIPGTSPFVANASSLIWFISAMTCHDQCGVNTWCTGNWTTPSSLKCSCLNGYSSPNNNGTACTVKTPTLSSGWFVANTGVSCNIACASKQPCNAAAMKAVNSASIFKAVASRAGITTQCQSNSASQAVSYNPAFDGKGGCRFNSVNSGCASVPSRTGFRRLCCCSTLASGCPLK
jgi:hypothetical protein